MAYLDAVTDRGWQLRRKPNKIILLFYEWSSSRHRSKSILLAATDRVRRYEKLLVVITGDVPKNTILSTEWKNTHKAGATRLPPPSYTNDLLLIGSTGEPFH